MSILFLRNRAQPVGIVGPDWNHWAARGLVAWLPGNGHFVEVVKGEATTPEGGVGFTTASTEAHGAFVSPNWDGSDDGVADRVHPNYANMTLTAWINYNGIGTSYYGLISRGGVFENSTSFCFGARDTGTEKRIFLYARTSGGTLQGIETSGVTGAAGWSRYVATRTSGATRIYRNGVLMTSGAGSTGTDGGQVLRFGRPNTFTTTDARFPAAAFDCRVYDRVWSDAEVQADYQEGPWTLFAQRRIWIPVEVAAPAGSAFNPLSGRGGAAAQPLVH